MRRVIFTGIVEEKGKIRLIRRQGRCARLDIAVSRVAEGTRIGDSVCVSGVCLTVTAHNGGVLSFDVMPQTFQASTLKYARVGDEVNLERALKIGDRLGGHFVTGHVDCVGVIRSRRLKRGDLEFVIGLEAKYLKYVVSKGSVAVDGISLTIADVKAGGFSVCIIPHTAHETTLGAKRSGDRVNIELDMLLKSCQSRPIVLN